MTSQRTQSHLCRLPQGTSWSGRLLLLKHTPCLIIDKRQNRTFLILESHRVQNQSISRGHSCRNSSLRHLQPTTVFAYIYDAMHIGWWNEWEAGTPELSGRWEKENRNRWDVPRSQPMLQPSSNFRNLRSWMALSKPAHQLIFFLHFSPHPSTTRLQQKENEKWFSVFSVWCWMSGRIRSRGLTGSPAWNLAIWLLYLRLRVPWLGHNEVWNSVILLTWTRPDVPPPHQPPHTLQDSTSHHHHRVLLQRVPPAIGETLNCVNCS